MKDLETVYQDTLNYLYSFVDFSLQRNFRYNPEQFDLGRMFQIMSLSGDPQASYPIIHVAGTKGKGSVSAMCASVLRAAGYRVGLYTSPHLDDYAERIQVDGQPIPHADLVDLVQANKGKIEAVQKLTTFEITTALAFLYFFQRGVQAAVIEVGLGGRLDATNVCRPEVSVITSLSYDHTLILGETLAQIAVEKAGIIKPGLPVVISPQQSEARLVLERIAQERSSPLVEVGRDYLYSALSHSLEGQSLIVWAAHDQPKVDAYLEGGQELGPSSARLEIPLLGYHQLENAATAYAALQIFRGRSLPVRDECIQQGFRQVSWPGRFELLRRDPPVIIDCAHNRDSALKLRLTLDDYFPTHPIILVFGASEDKDIEGMFAELLPRVRQVILVKSFHPRAADPELLLQLVHRSGKPAEIIPDVVDGLEAALRLAGNEAAVLVTGSIFVAAGARIAWYKRT